MIRWWTKRSPSRGRHGWGGTGLDDIVMIVGAAVIGASFFVGALDLWGTVHTRQVLTQAGQIVDRSIAASGCFTTSASTELDSYLQSNGLNPSNVVLQAPTTFSDYGQRQSNVVLGYDFQIPLPFGAGTLYKTYTQVAVPTDQSLAVPGDGANTGACATNLATTYAGSTNYGGTGGSTSGGSGSGAAVTSVTMAVTPNPVATGAAVTLSGVADVGTNPAPAGTPVTLTLPNTTLTASVSGASGAWSALWTASGPGSYTLTATSGLATTTTALTIQAATAQAITWQVPGSVQVGQAFTIQATVTDTNGYPVANGTDVAISSSDPTDVPNATVPTSRGVVSDTITTGITQNLSSVTVTATVGAVSQSATITVDPGPPESLSLTASSATLTAGHTVTLSGQVDGPDGTPPETGTPVTLQSETDSVDGFPTAATTSTGAYSVTATLTQAGTQQVTAQVDSNGSTITSAPVTLTVTPATATNLTNGAVAPSPVEQGAVATISGTVTDQYGNPVESGIPITVTGNGLAQTVSGTTNSHGAFSVQATFDTAGQQRVTVNANGTPLNGGVLSVNVLTTGADTLAASPSAPSVTAGGSTTITWTLTDSQGNPVSGEPIDFSLSPNVSGALTPTSAMTDSNGQVTVTVGPLTRAQRYTLEAAAANMVNVTGTDAITVTPDLSDLTVLTPQITPTALQSTSDGGTQDATLTGTVEDQYGNLVSGVSVSATGGWDTSQTATGSTNAEGQFSVSLDPVTIGGPYYPTIAVNGGSGTQYTSTELDVVNNLYGITLTAANGLTTSPAGTPYTVLATVNEFGGGAVIPVPNAAVTFTVSSGDTTSNWGAPGTPPTPTSGSSVTVTTNSSGQAEAEVAFMPATGSSTITASWATDNTTTAMHVTVTANTPSTLYWDDPPSPDPQTAGQPFALGVQLVDSNGFGLSSGQSVNLAFAGAPNVTLTTGYGNGVYGWITGAMTSTVAGTNWVVPFNVNGTAYDGSGDPSLPGVQETIDPGPMTYFYPELSSNGSSALSGESWTTWQSPSQGPINGYGTLADPPTNGTAYWTSGFGVDQYGNQITGATATLTCTASNGGSCPSTSSTASGSWGSFGSGFISGSYTLTYVPTSGPTGIASSPATTHVTWTVPGLRGWNVQVGNGSTVIGSGSGGTIALGNLPNQNGADQLNFYLYGLDENGNGFGGYTNNGTNAEGVYCISATNGGVCPSSPLGATVPLPTYSGSGAGQGWSGLTQFRSGQYVLSIRAGQYGDGGGQNWTPTWYNTHVSFTVPWILSNFTGPSLPSCGPDGGTWSLSSNTISAWSPMTWNAGNWDILNGCGFTMPNTPVVLTWQGQFGSGNTDGYNMLFVQDTTNNNVAELGTSWDTNSGNSVGAAAGAANGSYDNTYSMEHLAKVLTSANTYATYQLELVPGATYYDVSVNGEGWTQVDDSGINGSAYINAGDSLSLYQDSSGSQAVTNKLGLAEMAAP